jgi:O-antigen ligase
LLLAFDPSPEKVLPFQPSRLLHRDIIFATYLILVFLLGGGSRTDILSLVILRPLSAVAAVWFALSLRREDWKSIKIPLTILGGMIVLVALQLLPLPPNLWHSFPGRSLVAREDILVGFGDIWRPLSLSPDATTNSFYSLLTPLSVLFGFAGLDTAGKRGVTRILLALVGFSVLISLLQLLGGQRSAFYLYSVTNRGLMVGLFANRNHNALFIACALPLLALLGRRWVQSPGGTKSPKVMIGSVAAIGVLPVLAAVGSRIAFVAGLVGFVFAAYLFLRGNEWMTGMLKRYRRWVLLAGAALIAATALVVLTFGNAAQRIGSVDASEIRFAIWRASWAVLERYFPVGAGFGSFDPVYRAGEPLSTIGPSYINHAHNDFLEVIVEGGLFALLLLAAAIVLFVLKAVRLVRGQGQPKSTALAGFTMIVLLLIGSTTDYPLRVPSLMSLMAIASAWFWGARIDAGAAWRQFPDGAAVPRRSRDR